MGLTKVLQLLIARQEVQCRSPTVMDEHGIIKHSRRLLLRFQKGRHNGLYGGREALSFHFSPAVTNLDQRQMQIAPRIVVLSRFVLKQPTLKSCDLINDSPVRQTDQVYTVPDVRTCFPKFSDEYFIENNAG